MKIVAKLIKQIQPIKTQIFEVKLTQDVRKKNNLENIRRNLVSNQSCRGQNKTIIFTRLPRF